MNINIDEICSMLESDVENNSLDDMMKRVAEGHTSIQQATGITDQQLEVIYSLAYSQYTVGKYDMSAKLFALLTTVSPYVYKFWFGLGASLHMNEAHETAIEAYTMALAALEKDDPQPCFSVGECYLAIDNKKDALAAFRLAQNYAGDKPEFKSIKEKSSNFIDVLEKTTNTQQKEEVLIA